MRVRVQGNIQTNNRLEVYVKYLDMGCLCRQKDRRDIHVNGEVNAGVKEKSQL